MEAQLLKDKAAGFTLPKLPTEIDCPPGDIFDLPTKADLVNMINKISDIPSQLRVFMVELGTDLTAEAKAEMEAIIKEIESYMETFEEILKPYWKTGTVRDWSKEAKEAIYAAQEADTGYRLTLILIEHMIAFNDQPIMRIIKQFEDQGFKSYDDIRNKILLKFHNDWFNDQTTNSYL